MLPLELDSRCGARGEYQTVSMIDLGLERHQNTLDGRAGALPRLHQPLNTPAKSGEVPREGFRAGDRQRYKNSSG